MKSIILLPLCFAFAFCLGEPYSFGYTTADGQSRQESGAHGNVQGSYSYTDANGDFRQVRYTADALGFRPEGDISVDRRTAEKAAIIAELAPKDTNTFRHNNLPLNNYGFSGQYLPQQSLFSQYDTRFAAPFTSQLTSPMLGLKSYAAPAYNMLATGPAFSSYNSAINNYGSQLKYGSQLSYGSQLLSPAATIRTPGNYWK